MNKFKQFQLKPMALSFVALGLAACGGTGQDVGQVSSFSKVTYSGVAVDGHLARSTVYFDYDNNGTRSPWEPFAYTDNDGYYSYNPKTDTDYCADLEADTAIYCLQADKHSDSMVIRVDGGYDVVTGEPFKGQLSRRVDVAAGEAVTDSVISPLTTVVSSASSDDDKQSLLLALGIDETDLDVDYFDSDGNNGVDQALFNTALKLHKINNLMADAVEDQYGDVLGEAGTPDDLSASVYRHIGAQLLANNVSLDQAIHSDTFVGSVLAQTENDARELFKKRDMELPSGAGLDSTRTGQRVAAMARVIDALLPAEEPANEANLHGRARAVEALAIKNIEDNSGTDASIATAAAFLTNTANRARVDTLVDALSQSDVDLNALVRNDFRGTDMDSEEAINAAVRLPAGASKFSGLAGTRLRVSDMNLGVAPNHLDDSEVEAYFLGGPNATEGRLIACVKHVDDATSDGKMGEASTRGERVTGQWSLLSPNASDGGSYSVILTLNFLGAKYQAIMKSAGTEMIDGKPMQSIRFDYAGEIRSWHSEMGIQPQGTVPESSRACAESLPSRIGL